MLYLSTKLSIENYSRVHTKLNKNMALASRVEHMPTQCSTGQILMCMCNCAIDVQDDDDNNNNNNMFYCGNYRIE